jgi:hypothetical protein
LDATQLAVEISFYERINRIKRSDLLTARATIRNVMLGAVLVFLAQSATKEGFQVFIDPLTVGIHR